MINPAQHGWRDGKGAWKLCLSLLLETLMPVLVLLIKGNNQNF